MLLLETAGVFALPGWCAFRLSSILQRSGSFFAWPALSWLFIDCAISKS